MWVEHVSDAHTTILKFSDAKQKMKDFIISTPLVFKWAARLKLFSLSRWSMLKLCWKKELKKMQLKWDKQVLFLLPAKPVICVSGPQCNLTCELCTAHFCEQMCVIGLQLDIMCWIWCAALLLCCYAWSKHEVRSSLRLSTGEVCVISKDQISQIAVRINVVTSWCVLWGNGRLPRALMMQSFAMCSYVMHHFCNSNLCPPIVAFCCCCAYRGSVVLSHDVGRKKKMWLKWDKQVLPLLPTKPAICLSSLWCNVMCKLCGAMLTSQTAMMAKISSLMPSLPSIWCHANGLVSVLFTWKTKMSAKLSGEDLKKKCVPSFGSNKRSTMSLLASY